MALYCTNCRTVAEDGDAVCRTCGNGFVSRLACSRCNRVVPSGQAYCSSCTAMEKRRPPPEPFSEERHPSGYVPPAPPMAAAGALAAIGMATLPALTAGSGAHGALAVPDGYRAGSHGAKSEVFYRGRDAEIMTRMNQVAALLLALAAEMNDLVAVGESTRGIMRGCRVLAADLQGEVEMRRGSER